MPRGRRRLPAPCGAAALLAVLAAWASSQSLPDPSFPDLRPEFLGHVCPERGGDERSCRWEAIDPLPLLVDRR